MSPNYSNTELHRFIKDFTKARSGELVERSDEIFTIRFTNSIAPKEYTYQPVVAREKGITLIAAGSSALEEILKETLETGALCSVELRPKQDEESQVLNYFKDNSFSCQECDNISIGNKEVSFCVKSPQCYHKINNAKITSTEVVAKCEVNLFQFHFSLTFRNKLAPKSEETLVLLVDEDGAVHDFNVLEDESIEVTECRNLIGKKNFENARIQAYKQLDELLEQKLALFDLEIEKEMKNKLRSYDKRLKEERRQRLFSKKEFDEKEWQSNRDSLLRQEEDSYRTRVSVKLTNLLVVRTSKIDLRITLSNNSNIETSFILGIAKPRVFCPTCGKEFHEGYATEDQSYVCIDCAKQSIETGKIYSRNYQLFTDPSIGECFEPELGFVCAVCGKRGSRLLEFKCAFDGSSVCLYHCKTCDICHMIFSEKNLSTSAMSGRRFCPSHFTKCAACDSIIGLDEYRTCKATGKNLCSCTPFVSCSLCQQEYSSLAIQDNKCPACNSLAETNSEPLIEVVRRHDSDRQKTTKWLVGRNAHNAVVVAKGFFSSTLYVVEKDSVVHRRNISFFEKLRSR